MTSDQTLTAADLAKDSRERRPGDDYSYLREATGASESSPEIDGARYYSPTNDPNARYPSVTKDPFKFSAPGPGCKLIGLYSPFPGCGKTTVAKALAPYGYERISFAQPLRDMLEPFIRGLGLEGTSWLTSPSLKDEPIPGLNVSSRHLMRTLGTEWGRSCVHPDIWPTIALSRVKKIIWGGGSVVIDDVRFPNEAVLIKKHGGQLWRVERPDATAASEHPSDTSMADWVLEDFDEVIYNSGSLKCLIDGVADLVEHL